MLANENRFFRSSISFGILILAWFIVSQPSLAEDKLKFAWPVPSRVTVTETILKKGKTAKTRYDMVLRAQDAGNNRELHFENYQFIELEGIDLTVTENREKLGPVLNQLTAVGSMLPTLVINPDGNVEDVVGLDKCVDGALKLIPGADPKMEEMLRSPEMMAQMKQKSVDFWRVWVETWLVCKSASGSETSIKMDVPILGGETISAPLVVRNEGPVSGANGDIRLTASAIIDGEPAKKAMQQMMMAMVEKIPVKEGVKPFSPDMVKSLRRTTNFLVITNPKTLQPSRAESEAVVELTIEDQQKSQVEKHEYVFNWTTSAK